MQTMYSTDFMSSSSALCSLPFRGSCYSPAAIILGAQERAARFGLTFVANLSDVSDSFRCEAIGDKFKIIFSTQSALLGTKQMQGRLARVFEFPLKECCNRYVSCNHPRELLHFGSIKTRAQAN